MKNNNDGKVTMTKAELIAEDSTPVTVSFASVAGSERYTQEQLQGAFALVANLENWKNPIDAIIHESFHDIVAVAVPFMTCSEAKFSPVAGKPGFVRVQADGYYVACGA
jgi:hypothetical protein